MKPYKKLYNAERSKCPATYTAIVQSRYNNRLVYLIQQRYSPFLFILYIYVSTEEE